MSVSVLYTTTATATGGRDGHATTRDGSLDIKLATPKELGGAGGAGNNPEQLFAAGYAACFLGAMKFVATQGGPKVPQDTSVTATVGIGPRSEGGFGLDIAIEIALPGLSSADAQSLVDKARQVCPAEPTLIACLSFSDRRAAVKAENVVHQRIAELGASVEKHVATYEVNSFIHFAATRRHLRDVI